jgi:hypothetical protein
LVADVLKGAAQAEARQPLCFPVGSVGVFLRQSPFEPLSFASLENLTLETVFLVILASGRRSSEVCALSCSKAEVAFKADGSMSLYFLPEFQAKDQRPSDRSPFVIIRFLVDLASPEKPDFLNCPVRSLRYYRRHLSDIVYNTVLREFPPSAAEVGSYIYRSAIFRVFNEFLWCLPAVLYSELA